MVEYMKLNDRELKQITGGVSVWAVVGAIAALIFGVGAVDGYVEDKDSVFEEMKEVKPDIVLVALGIPKQEILIYNHLKDFDKGIFVGVGGSFDVISGSKKRAPKIFVKLKLEWLYRITREPKRLKRFYESNIKYLLKIKA